ncbi:MAG: hypothetical protein M3Y70_02215 [Pseudomonadota bacterium]|nr:hypothetical protein [Pseudomonadota bacterium]
MTRADPRWLRRLDAIYALALRLYPRRFRMEWEADMRQAFRDRCREVARGERKPLALIADIVPDLAAGAGREQLHSMQDAAMFKRNLAIVMLLLFATLLASRSTVSDATSAAQQWWEQRQARLLDASWHDYRLALGDAAARDATPRGAAIAAILYAGAGDHRAQTLWDVAVDAGDPLALWMSATDCPVQHCNTEAAIVALERKEPGNAAVAHLRMAQAARAGDDEGVRSALRAMGSAVHYRAHGVELMAGLLQTIEAVPAPTQLQHLYRSEAGAEAVPLMLAQHIWMHDAPKPVSEPLPGYCAAPVAQPLAGECRAAARVLAGSETLMARIIGLKAWQRLRVEGSERAELDQRTRDQRWLIQQASQFWGADSLRSDSSGWRDAWLAANGEVAIYQRLMRDRGIPLSAPASFRIE